MDISAYLRRVARGKNGSENLNMEEAQSVLSALLADDADALQLGAFLIAQRMKGESSEELAGFVHAARQCISGYGSEVAVTGAVDMPCYAGKRRAAPVHLAAALKARDAGIPVVLHGMQHIEGRLSAWQALQTAGVHRAACVQEASLVLKGEGIVYIDVADICPPLSALLMLRPRLGVRSFAHTVARLLNPLGCAGQINGVFHTPYVSLMAQANTRLDQPRSLIFMGAEGEAELYASRQKLMTAQVQHQTAALTYPDALCDLYPREIESDVAALLTGFTALCSGQMDAREAVVLQRMQQAFVFASTGRVSQDWVEIVQGESKQMKQEIRGEEA